MKLTILSLALLAAASAFAGDNVPGNCGNGSGHGNGCTEGTSNGQGGSSNVGVVSNGGAGGKGGKSNSNSNSNSTSLSTSRGGRATSSSTGGVATVSVSSTEGAYRAAASTAYSPALHPTVNCALATSIGVQGMAAGISIGGTHIDESCQTIEQAKILAAFGNDTAAQEVLCELPRVRAARKRAGDPCAADLHPIAVDEPTDPFVRARLGLPPL